MSARPVTYTQMRLFIFAEKARREAWLGQHDLKGNTRDAEEARICDALIMLIDWCTDHNDMIRKTAQAEAEARRGRRG